MVQEFVVEVIVIGMNRVNITQYLRRTKMFMPLPPY